MRHVRFTVLAASAVAVLLLVLLIHFLALGSSFAFFLIGSIFMTLIFVTILLWILVHHDFFDGSGILGTCTFPILCFVLPLFTVTLLAVVIMLCIRLKATAIFFICVGADLVLVLGFSSPVLVRKVIAQYKKRTRSGLKFSDVEEEPPEVEFSYLRRVGGLPKKFRYEELKAATNNFQTPIGRGGSGSVFKGVLGDGLPVAVKRIEGELHGEREFRSEITAIVSAQHVNLVTILGYCLVPGGYRYLVYELIQNGSLDSWIFPGREENNSSCLTWALRYQVAIDVAKALAYLHHDCRSRILHLDVKPQNILLDENFRARVSDFGISRMMGKDESRVVTTIRGTRGYLAPEWFSREGISEKSDVFSFGLVLLELVGGRRNCEFFDNGVISQRTWFYFPKVASEKMREGKLMEVVDERLMDGGVEEAELRIMVYVGIWCIQERVELRPSMELVVSMLKGHVPVDMPPETKMFMVDLVLPVDSETASVLSRGQSSTSAARTDYP